MEVRNRFKGLDLIDRVPDELWNKVRGIVQETRIETITRGKKCETYLSHTWICTYIYNHKGFDLGHT